MRSLKRASKCIWPSGGILAGYLAIFNALLHIAPGLRRREYNPGLATAMLLFLPVGGWCVVESGSGAGLQAHLVGLGGAIAVHAAVVAHVVRRLQRLPKSA